VITATFYIGLARKTQEIAFKGYWRQPLVLSFDAGADSFGNKVEIAFAPALVPWGLVDGFTLSTSNDGPVVAVSPLLLPVFISAGDVMLMAPGCVLMNRASAGAILNRKPVLIGSRQSAA
jgi:hypothetical protein